MQKFFVFLVFTLCLLIPIRPVCGADSTTFNPTTVAVIAKGTSSSPVGTIISWPVAQNPADWQNSDGSYNWLECNGQSISKTVYPELFALVGGQVPDLRGLFLRGHGGNSAALGEPQGDAIRNVTGRVFSLGMANGGTGPFWSYVDGYFGIGSGSYTKHTTMFDLSRVVPTGNENRPVNMAVRYLVRARP